MDSVTITFDSDEVNEDKLIGQVRKLAKSYQKQLDDLGFNINTQEEIINGIKVEIPDFSFESEWDNDKQKNTVKINFGTDTMTIPENFEKELNQKADIEAIKKGGKQVVTRDGKNYSVEPRKFTDISDAVQYLINSENKIKGSKQNEFIKNNGRISTGMSKFENI